MAFNTIIPYKSITTNATSIKWLLNGLFSETTGPEFNHQITTGLHTIGMVAYNGNCCDTTTVAYFSAGILFYRYPVMANYGTYEHNEEEPVLITP